MTELSIDGRQVGFEKGQTLFEIARASGVSIPTLCHDEGRRRPGACMVCVVRDERSGSVLPACSTAGEAGMDIDASSEDVRALRRANVELLLSEHRGECEAPCRLACPQFLDLPAFLAGVAAGGDRPDFAYDPAICETCGGRCEKVCRRGKLDEAVSIRGLLALARATPLKVVGKAERLARYLHHARGLTPEDLAAMAVRADGAGEGTAEQKAARRCLQCACLAREGCELRRLATDLGARQSRFRNEAPPAFTRVEAGGILFEPGKCIRCERCVEVGEGVKPGHGPVIAFRGTAAIVSPPVGADYAEAFRGFEKEFAGACPTGALVLRAKWLP